MSVSLDRGSKRPTFLSLATCGCMGDSSPSTESDVSKADRSFVAAALAVEARGLMMKGPRNIAVRIYACSGELVLGMPSISRKRYDRHVIQELCRQRGFGH